MKGITSVTQKDNLKGVFYIVRGQYRHKVPPAVENRITGEINYIGGYDPENTSNTEWYRVMDNITHHCICCSGDLDKCINTLIKVIKTYKTQRNYFRHVCSITSEDYYETHYLGKRPLTPEQVSKKAEGRCPRVSPISKSLEDSIYDFYGAYFSEIVAEAEDMAYSQLEEETPLKKTKKRFMKMQIEEVEEKVEKSKEEIKPSGMKLKKIRKLRK